MSTAAAHSHVAAIDAALAKGEWWMRLFDELAHLATRQAQALPAEAAKGLWHVVDDLDRFLRALRLAVVAAMGLQGFLRRLAQLRKLSPGDLAAARASAKAKADAEAVAREAAREKARARREARAAEVRECVVAIIDRETPDRRDRDPLVEALDRRLAVDPALVALDDLPLRETVMRICADLGITPDWSRWEAGDWTMTAAPTRPTPPAPNPTLTLEPRPRPIPALWPLAPPRKLAPSAVLQDVSRRLAPRTDTAISLVLQAGPFAPPWLPPRPG